MPAGEAKFRVGQVIRHRMFGYLGVVFDVDPVFSASDDWYDQVARSRPPKDAPWYHVLVDQARHTTYVAERNLAPADEPRAIRHALVDELFDAFDGERYVRRGPVN